MKKRLWIIAGLTLLLAAGVYAFSSGMIGAAAAQGQATAEPTLPAVKAPAEIISEGVLEPERYVELSFNTGGLVAEVSVAEGEQVEAGQVLARLSSREQLEAAITQANLELVNAQLALDELNENYPLQAAQSQQAVADAQKALEDAGRYLANVKGSGDPADIDAAKAAVVIAKDRLDKARKDYRPYENKAEDNLIRAALLTRLSEAQKNYDRLVARLNNLGGSANDTTVAQAEAGLAVAEANLEQAKKDYEMYLEGPDPEALQAAQARLANAEAQLAAAEAARADLELVAPFAGKVVKLDLKAGEFANPGAPVLTLADFSTWKVETTDLTELNVVDIAVGDPVVVSFDALPEEELPGVVVRIGDAGENRQGDIIYTVLVEPEPADAWAEFQDVLRWKMTASVRIANGE